MKGISFFLLITFIHFSTFLNAQESIMDNFSLTEVNNQVVLNWTISKGITCNGIAINRSEDSLNFNEIGLIDGICGEEEKSVKYSFTDKSPIKNQKNYYRLEFGGVGTSEVKSIILVEISSKGFSIRPNPFLYESKLYLDNKNNVLHELSIYNINGSIINTILSRENYFLLKKGPISNGMYFFVLENTESGEVIKGKFLVGTED